MNNSTLLPVPWAQPKTFRFKIPYSLLRMISFLMLAFFMVISDNATAQLLPQSVSSDKDDYAPGEIAHITGEGWYQDQTVHVEFVETPDYPDFHVYDVTVNADGTWVINYLIEDRHLGVKFTVNATGNQSGLKASTTFTDAAQQVTPRAGTKAGGTSVTIAGSGGSFGGGSYTITFGVTPTVSANRASATVLNNITTPARNAGTVNVIVNGPDAPSSSTITNGYTFVCRDATNVIFDESVGLGSGTTLIPAYEAANSFDNDGLTMSGTADIRSTTPSSSSSDYSWATANGNVFFTTVVGTNFQIAGINTSGLSNLELSFAINKNITTSDGSDFIVEVSSDGTTFSPLSFASFPTGTGTTGWYYRIASGSIPATANLRIRFRQNGTTTQYRIDDIRLISSPPITSQPSNQIKCIGQSAAFSVTATGSGLTYQWRKNGSPIPGANGASYTIASVAAGDAGNYDVIVSGGCSSTTSGSASLTVNSSPLITTSYSNISVNNDPGLCGAVVNYAAASATGTPSPSITYSSASGTLFGIGNTIVTVTATNTCGADIKTFNVLITDTEAPVADVATLATVTGECSATVTAPTATDNCEGTITGTTSDPTTYSAQGTYTITWTYDDGNGNTSQQTQTVVVDDVTAPVADVATLATVTGECSATVTAPTATDNCEGTITGTTSDPITYSAQGTYTVHWTYDDGNGNTSQQTQTVVVDDVTAPVADVATLATVTGECSASVTAPTATDNCEGTITGTTSDPITYSAQGTYTVHWTYDDGNGNTSQQTQTVVVDDVTAPVADVATLATVTGECSASVTAPTATDNCEGTITGTTNDPTSYSAQGTYTVHWTYDDGNGNTSQQTQTVVVDDVTAPVADVATLATVTGECSASVTAPTATDNCEGTITGTTNDPTSYSAQGTYTVHWTYDDGNGNTSQQTQTVVVDDVTAPVADVATLATVTGECSATVTAPTATDNCEGTITGTTTDPVSYSAQGTYTIHWTYDDGNGNTSQQTQTVVVDDVTAPSITCPANILLSACTPTVTWSVPTASDNCSGATVTQTAGPAPGSTFANGTTTTITYKATDIGGNTTSCSFTVTRAAALASTCNVTNTELYFGYTGDQTATFSVTPSGGAGPYTVSITMSRPLLCNQVNDAGDEVWTGGAGGTTINNGCPVYPGLAAVAPVSTKTINSGSYGVTVTLMGDVTITATITDANGCVTTCSKFIHAEDVRCFAGKSNIAKVTLCHKTGSTKNPCVKICVDDDAVAEHLAHGDFLGNCTANCLPPPSVTSSTTSVSYAGSRVLETKEPLKVKIMPNPSTGRSEFTLRAEGNSNETMQIVVIDMYGKIVHTAKGSAYGDYRFGGQFVSGVYVVKVLHGTDISTYKIVKTK